MIFYYFYSNDTRGAFLSWLPEAGIGLGSRTSSWRGVQAVSHRACRHGVRVRPPAFQSLVHLMPLWALGPLKPSLSRLSVLLCKMGGSLYIPPGVVVKAK